MEVVSFPFSQFSLFCGEALFCFPTSSCRHIVLSLNRPRQKKLLMFLKSSSFSSNNTENITVFKRILYTTVVFLSGFLNQQQYKTLPGNPRVVCLQVGRWKPRSDLERENVWKNWVDVCMRRNFISDAWTCVFLTQLISVCCLTEHFL